MRPFRIHPHPRFLGLAILILSLPLASCNGPTAPPASEVALSATSLTFFTTDELPITITNLGNTSVAWQVHSISASWLTLAPSSGTLGSKTSATMTVSIKRAVVPRGTHSGTLQIRAGTEVLLVTVSVEENSADASLDPSSLHIGPLSESGVVQVVNLGPTRLDWVISSAAPWSKLSPSSGTVSPGGRASVAVRVDRTGLSAGEYVGTLYLSSAAGSKSSTLTVEVGGGSKLDLNPDALQFDLGLSTLPVRVVNNSYERLKWSAQSEATWLTVSPAAGEIPALGYLEANVKVNRLGLSHGMHSAGIQFLSDVGAAAITVQAMAAPVGSSPPPSPPDSVTDPPEPGPGPSPGPAKLSVSTSVLDFGETQTQRQLTVRNTGQSPLEWSAQTSTPWLTLMSSSGQLAAGTSQTVIVHASRSGLSAGGLYEGSIHFSSNGGAPVVPVRLRIPSASPPPSSTPVLSEIDATGTQDVTNELNAYLASVPDGSVIQFPAGAKYRVEGTVLLRERRNLTIEGNGALVFAMTDGSEAPPPPGPGEAENWPRTRSHIEIKGGSAIVIRNLKVRGANPNAGMEDAAYVSALESQHAFEIIRATNIELDRVSASDVYGDFVYVGGGYGEPWSRDIHIHDSHFERNGRQGIAITRGQDVLIERNYIGDTRRATFDFEPSSKEGGALNIVIRDNEIGPGRLKFLASDGRGPNISFTVENNTLHRAMNIWVKTDPDERRGPILIRGNVSDQTHGAPNAVVELSRIDGIVVQNNYQPLQKGRDMVFVGVCESSAIDIRDNVVPGGREFEVRESCSTVASGE